jgi:DNA-binding NarL/FixJ family response regulator
MAYMSSAAAPANTGRGRAPDLVLLEPPDDVPSEPSVIGAPTIRVLTADGQPVVRAGLRALLENEPDIVVVGDAADGDQALALARELRPDVLLVDADIPGVDVLEITRQVVEDPDWDGTKVVVLATRETDECLFPALRAGVSGFLVKDTDAIDLVEAVRVVAAGSALLSPRATRRLIAEFASQPQPRRPTGEQLDELSPREREVMTLVASGMSNDEIAERFVISRATVKTHVSRALGKLDVRDRAQLVAVAYQTGLVHPGQSRALRAVPAPGSMVAA